MKKLIQFLVECLIALNWITTVLTFAFVSFVRCEKKKHWKSKAFGVRARKRNTSWYGTDASWNITGGGQVTNSFGLIVRVPERLWPEIKVQMWTSMNLMIIIKSVTLLAGIEVPRAMITNFFRSISNKLYKNTERQWELIQFHLSLTYRICNSFLSPGTSHAAHANWNAKKVDWKKNMLAQYYNDPRRMASLKCELLQMVDANDMENYDILKMA